MANIPLQQQLFIISFFFTLSLSTQLCLSSSKQSQTIYEILRSNGLPMGLLPKGITNFTFDDSGRFEVHLDQACNSKFENEFHYDRNVSGKVSYGQIERVSGISAQDLFMWFTVKEIRVDIPSSGLIYFDVGVVHKQFSLSSFDSPRDCLVSSVSTDIDNNQLITQSVPKVVAQQHLDSLISDQDGGRNAAQISTKRSIGMERVIPFIPLFHHTKQLPKPRALS